MTRKIIVSAFAAAILAATSVPCAQGENAQTMTVQTMSEQLYFVTVRIETQSLDGSGNPFNDVGTAFILDYHINDNTNSLFLVTSKHLVQRAQKVAFFFTRGKDGLPVIGEKYNIVLEGRGNQWFYHPDPNVDVAIMPIVPVLKEVDRLGWTIFYRSIPNGFSYTLQEGSIDAVEQIAFVGYPSGIFDSVNYLPVVRTGTTATPILVNYAGARQFLIDASVFPGSSGSPVFIMNRGGHPTRQGELAAGDRLIFLGMLAAAYQRDEIGSIGTPSASAGDGTMVKTRQIIDLGIVIKADVILETIESFLKSKGLM